MLPVFTPHGWEGCRCWQAVDRTTLKRVDRLLEDALRDPLSGVGKPEPLRHILQGAWSRRIADEHRLVYLAADDGIVALQARHHYGS